MSELWQQYGPHTPEAIALWRNIARLILAAILGGVIGLEREMKRKPAGFRTNMFICFGAAMFTVLSLELASYYPGDHTRIAAQIIPGIGFIGAGSILHSRGSVTGLTTAATLFVVASVGMAVGGGLYLTAVFATGVIVVALTLLGWMEARFNLKPLVTTYQVIGASAEDLVSGINQVLEEEHHAMQSVHVGRSNSHFRVQFNVEATQKEQESILRKLRGLPLATHVESLGPQERE